MEPVTLSYAVSAWIRRAWHSRETLLIVIVASAVLALLRVASASAGTYEIDNCPSAPVPNGNAGPWTVFGSPQNAKGGCSGGLGDFIGPLGATMSPNTTAGVSVTAPAGITIREAKAWWYVPHQSSGADTFALALADGAVIGEYATPLSHEYTPSDFVLASTTTSFALVDYCSSDAGANGCAIGSGENPDLKLFGVQLTLADSSLPAGETTGGALAGQATVSGRQALSYTARDTKSGIRAVSLTVDGKTVAKNDYLPQCPYQDFLACPANISDTISWDTSTALDGAHEVDLRITSAGGNTTIADRHVLTTHNAPTIVSPPSIDGQAQVEQTLTGTPATFSAPEGAGALSNTANTWLRCSDASATHCSTIAGATATDYRPSRSDTGYYIVLQSVASDKDGTTVARSQPTLAVTEPAKETAGSGSQPATNWSANTAGAGGTGGSAGNITVNINTSPMLGDSSPWQITLNAHPKTVRKGTKIKLAGIVNTRPLPAHGKLIFLRARIVTEAHGKHNSKERAMRRYGKWVTFMQLHTRGNGTYETTYRFRRSGKHTYQFSAVAPREGGYTNPTGTSRAVTIREIR